MSAPNLEWHLLAGLVKALDWFDNSLQNILASRGFAPVHRTQSLILVFIASGISSPSEIARELRLSRQNVHQMAKALIESGLVEQHPVAQDPRRIQYRLTESSLEVRTSALEALDALAELMVARTRASKDEMRAFQRILSADWGPVVADDGDLRTHLRQHSARSATGPTQA